MGYVKLMPPGDRRNHRKPGTQSIAMLVLTTWIASGEDLGSPVRVHPPRNLICGWNPCGWDRVCLGP